VPDLAPGPDPAAQQSHFTAAVFRRTRATPRRSTAAQVDRAIRALLPLFSRVGVRCIAAWWRVKSFTAAILEHQSDIDVALCETTCLGVLPEQSDAGAVSPPNHNDARPLQFGLAPPLGRPEGARVRARTCQNNDGD
jgi:hypothetical protein